MFNFLKYLLLPFIPAFFIGLGMFKDYVEMNYKYMLKNDESKKFKND